MWPERAMWKVRPPARSTAIDRNESRAEEVDGGIVGDASRVVARHPQDHDVRRRRGAAAQRRRRD
jgi:hypothetical protein